MTETIAPSATETVFIRAEERGHLPAFYNKIAESHPNVPWTFGESHDAEHGWSVVWQVGNQALVHPPKWARAFTRSLRAENTAAAMKKRGSQPLSPERRRAWEEMLTEWDTWGKLLMEKNRRGDVPKTAPAPFAAPDQGCPSG